MAGNQMKKIYIAHPLRGETADIDEIWKNSVAIDTICRNVSAIVGAKDTLLLSPIHAFSFMPVFGDQKDVFEQCRNMLSLADEVWVFGDWASSEGCKMEIEYANKLNIPVVFHHNKIKELDECLA
jgi:hypothetical protein